MKNQFDQNVLISVIMSAYNSSKYIRECIRSVLNQTFKNFEFIIVDDASTDNTINIITEFDDSRIILIRNDVNMGLTHNLNCCIKIAKGKYIARIDSDDLCVKDRFMKQYEYMEQHPEVGVLGANAYLIDEDSIIKGVSDVAIGNTNIQNKMMIANPLIHPSVIIRKSLIEEYYYDEKYRVCQDYRLWTQIGSDSIFENMKEPLIFYRLNPDGATRKARNKKSERVKYLLPIVSDEFKKRSIDNLSDSELFLILSLALMNYSEISLEEIQKCFKKFDSTLIKNILSVSLFRFKGIKLLGIGYVKEFCVGGTRYGLFLLKQLIIRGRKKSIQKEIDIIARNVQE